MRKMNHFKLLAVICAMTLFASCNFEEINTNQFEMSDGEGAMDGFADYSYATDSDSRRHTG